MQNGGCFYHPTYELAETLKNLDLLEEFLNDLKQ